MTQRLYRKPLQQLEKRGLLRVVALVDPLESHASLVGTYFRKAVWYRRLEDALPASAPQLTLVLSPAHLHCGQTLEAIAGGSHVLCEKPMASTAADCRQMGELARRTGRVLAVGMIRRFFPAYVRLRQLLRDEALGRLIGFEYREGHKFEWEVTTAAAFRPRRQGGTGVLFDIGPHAVDHVAWTLGELAVTAYSDDALAGIESNAVLDLESAGCRGTMHLSWNGPQANELRIAGEKGEAVLRIGCFDQLAVKRTLRFEPVDARGVAFAADAHQPARHRMSPRTYTEAIYCQIVQVIRAIRLGEAPAVDAETGGRTISLLESALAIARPLDVPWMSLAQQESFRRLHWSRSA